MAEKTPTKKGEPSDDSFSTPLSQMKEPSGTGRDLVTKAFQKKLLTSGNRGSSMKTEIIEATVGEPDYVQEDASQAPQQQEEWQMHWTEEGYLYYYNSKSGESVWAELNDPNYGAHAPTQSAQHDDKGRLAETETESDEESEGDTEYSEDSSDYDEDEDEGSDGSTEDYDSEDPEVGLQGQRKFKGNMLLNAELEDDFQEYLASEEGRADMEAEQRAIKRRLEEKFKEKQQKALRKAERQARGASGSSSDRVGKSHRNEGDEGSSDGQVLSPIEAVGGALHGIFGGVARVAAPLLDKAGTVVDKYWKGEYHGPPQDKEKRGRGKGKGSSKANAARHERSRHPPTEEARSAELLEAALGTGGGEGDDADSDTDSSVASLSSEDSDVQELASPLLPTWLQPKKFRGIVGEKAISATHELATSTLTSAEWLLEMTGYGVTVVGQMVWVRMNAVLKRLVDDHYSHGLDTRLEGGERVTAPAGATTQAYLVPAPPQTVPPSASKVSAGEANGRVQEALPSPGGEEA